MSEAGGVPQTAGRSAGGLSCCPLVPPVPGGSGAEGQRRGGASLGCSGERSSTQRGLERASVRCGGGQPRSCCFPLRGSAGFLWHRAAPGPHEKVRDTVRLWASTRSKRTRREWGAARRCVSRVLCAVPCGRAVAAFGVALG